VLLVVMVAAAVIVRRLLLRGRLVSQAVTWDCGYAAPTARMQYTGSSFAMPLVSMFRGILRTVQQLQKPDGLLPTRASACTQTEDIVAERAYRPAFAAVAWLAGRLRWMQQGRNQLYVLYIALAMLALLVWKLGAGQ
jgi:hypothetical protein